MSSMYNFFFAKISPRCVYVLLSGMHSFWYNNFLILLYVGGVHFLAKSILSKLHVYESIERYTALWRSFLTCQLRESRGGRRMMRWERGDRGVVFCINCHVLSVEGGIQWRGGGCRGVRKGFVCDNISEMTIKSVLLRARNKKYHYELYIAKCCSVVTVRMKILCCTVFFLWRHTSSRPPSRLIADFLLPRSPPTPQVSVSSSFFIFPRCKDSK